MKVLIIRLSSIGDIVLTTPVIRCLKTQRPDISIHYLTKKSFGEVVKHNPHIDKVHYLENDLDSLISELKKENFSFIIDLHKNLRTFKIKRSLNTPSYSYNKLNIKKWLLVNFKIDLMPDESIVERYMKTVSGFGVINDNNGLDYYTGELKLQDNDIPMSHRMGYYGFVIGGSYATKRFPVDKWIELCNQIHHPIILLGGPEDAENGKSIAATDNIKVYNACGKFSLNESALLVKMSKAVVTNDTGLMHIAAAYQKKIFSLWGNTTKKFGMFPYYGNVNSKHGLSYVFENEKLHCHPCSKLGYEKCPKGHFKCMKDIDINMIISKMRE